jgi:pilus assembly protein Flp/PilA
MSKIVNFMQQFWADEEGATAIEYGLLAALIAVVIIVSVALIGNRLDQVFDRVAACLQNSAGAGCLAAIV